MGDLRMSFEMSGERVDVAVQGEIDIASVRTFTEFVELACERRKAVVVIDLSGCEAIDGSGLASLAHFVLSPIGVSRVLIGRMSEEVVRTFELTEFDMIARFTDPSACAACGHAATEGDAFCVLCGSRLC